MPEFRLLSRLIRRPRLVVYSTRSKILIKTRLISRAKWNSFKIQAIQLRPRKKKLLPSPSFHPTIYRITKSLSMKARRSLAGTSHFRIQPKNKLRIRPLRIVNLQTWPIKRSSKRPKSELCRRLVRRRRPRKIESSLHTLRGNCIQKVKSHRRSRRVHCAPTINTIYKTNLSKEKKSFIWAIIKIRWSPRGSKGAHLQCQNLAEKADADLEDFWRSEGRRAMLP